MARPSTDPRDLENRLHPNVQNSTQHHTQPYSATTSIYNSHVIKQNGGYDKQLFGGKIGDLDQFYNMSGYMNDNPVFNLSGKET